MLSADVRRQVQANVNKTSTGEAYNGIWKSLGRMWREEGFRGFMKGNGINVVRVSTARCLIAGDIG
jgi:hypothetical protein